MQARECAVQLQRGVGFGTMAAAQGQQLAATYAEIILRQEQKIADLEKKLHPGRLDACGCIVATQTDCPSS